MAGIFFTSYCRRNSYSNIPGEENIDENYSTLEPKIFAAKPTCGSNITAISSIFFLVVGMMSAAPFMGAAHYYGGNNVPYQYTLLVAAGIGFTSLSTWALINLSRIIFPVNRQIEDKADNENICLHCIKTTALIVGFVALSAIAAISEYSIGFMTYYYDNNPLLPDLFVSPIVVGICNIGFPLYSLCLLIKKAPEILYHIEHYFGSFCKRVDAQLDQYQFCNPDRIKKLRLGDIERDRFATISRLKFYKSYLLSLSWQTRKNIMNPGINNTTQFSLDNLIEDAKTNASLRESSTCKIASMFFQFVSMVFSLGGLTFRGLLSYEGVDIISKSLILKIFVVAVAIISTTFVSLHVTIKIIKSFFSFLEHGTDNLALKFYPIQMLTLTVVILTIAGLSITSIIQVIKDLYAFDLKYLKTFITIAASLSFFILVGNSLFDFISFIGKELIRIKGSDESQECLEYFEKIDKLIDAVNSSNGVCKTVSAFIFKTETKVPKPSTPYVSPGSSFDASLSM